MATGGAILVARNASGSGPRPVSVARGARGRVLLGSGWGPGCGSVAHSLASHLPNPIPIPAPQLL